MKPCPDCGYLSGGHAPDCPQAKLAKLDREENERTIREHFDRTKSDPYDHAHGLDREEY